MHPRVPHYRRTPKKLNWQNIGWRNMRCLHIADEARRITLRRLLKLVFDIFRQRHSDYRGESRPDLPQSSREEKNEDAAFRCQISLLSLKFRDNSVERTFQASFRAHMDSTVTTARQTLLAFVLSRRASRKKHPGQKARSSG